MWREGGCGGKGEGGNREREASDRHREGEKKEKRWNIITDVCGTCTARKNKESILLLIENFYGEFRSGPAMPLPIKFRR